MRLESLQRPGGPPAPVAVLTIADGQVVAEGWRHVVRLPREGILGVAAVAAYRYETQKWRGPRAGYGRRTDEGLVLLSDTGRPVLVVPGQWDAERVAEAAGDHGLRVSSRRVSPRALVGVRRLRLAPRRRMFGYDVVALIAAAVFLREAAAFEMFGDLGIFGGLGRLLASLGGPFAEMELPASVSGGLKAGVTGLFWLSGLIVAAWLLARLLRLRERIAYRIWLRENARRAISKPEIP